MTGFPQALRGTFAGLAHPAALDHLVRLGITSVEILPAAAWIEERHLAARGLTNYWGYNPIAALAPDPRLAPGGWAEIRRCVAALAAAGIETIVDIVLNHTGEGDARGPTLSLRGLDNASYYRLPADDRARYVDDSGCGNTLALDRPPVVRLAMDALRAWAGLGGVHGFRFDLATSLGRRERGFDPAAPLLSAIAQDPCLRRLKLIAEPWDIGAGGYQAGAFPAEWGEWNDRFRDGVRRFWRGDPGVRGELATRLAGSSDLFASKRRPSRGVNFVVAHDGFTLADLVSYDDKHNAANGEGNRDGTDANFSWNNGVEGATENPAILAARARDQRALLATLLLARGTPMLAMGAELGFSLAGNNNAYCQDNAGSWLDWSHVDSRMVEWVRRLLAVRRDHPALRDDHFLSGATSDGLARDVEWCGADGEPLVDGAWAAPPDAVLTMVLYSDRGSLPDRVALVFNRGEQNDAVLPAPTEGCAWHLLADSGPGVAADSRVEGRALSISARAVMVFAERPDARPRGIGDPTLMLDRLARAAGIAPEWWEVDGTRHIVGADTKRALLASMRLPADSQAAIQGALEHLAQQGELRALPVAMTVRYGEAIELSLPVARGLNVRPLGLLILLEDGSERRLRLGSDEGILVPGTAVNGRPYGAWKVTLPALPIGRHRVVRDDAADAVCHLAVVPRRCHLPAPLGAGERRFGVSAQLYSLRRAEDQGIGDFTTLAELAAATAAAGGAVVGLNPLHALFGNERRRASPYHPSDRRFLDPIYLDVAKFGLPEAVGSAALSAQENVDYQEVWSAKKAILERQFTEFDCDAAEFAEYLRDGGDVLRNFAVFETISETRPGKSWHVWPPELRSPDAAGIAAFAAAHESRLRFHQFLQFLCDRQLRLAASGPLEIGLLRDLAVGAAPDGGEAWADARTLAWGASIGAPPDPFAPNGQVWGLPPPDPVGMATGGYDRFSRLLRANMRHAGVLRIDHVMQLSRLFWIPDGAAGHDGAYVAYPMQDLLGHAALESMRAQCMIVGEDLGTVPEGFRERLAEADIFGFRVLLLERDGIGFRPPSAYPAAALACVSTHDLPTLAGWWDAADITERAALGMLAPDAAARQVALRQSEKSALRSALADEAIAAGIDAPVLSVETAAGVHEFVGRAGCALMLVQAEELAGEAVAVNLPGTDAERPNWRRKLAPMVDDLFASPRAEALLRPLRGLRGRRDEG